MDEVIANYRI